MIHGDWLRGRVARVVVALVWLAPAISAGQTPASWTGGAGTTSYDDADNWSTPDVPVNTGTVTYDVTIPAGVTVWFDVDGVNEVTDLQLGAGSTLKVNAGKSLEVLDDAALYGYITTDNGTFLASAAAAQFPGDAAQLAVTGGGHIAVAATSYSSGGLKTPGSTYTPLSASGAGSLLDLASLQSLDARFDDGQYWTTTVQKIVATDGGQIDLSGLQTLYGAARSEDRLQLDVSGGGSVDLSSLTSIASGYTRFNVTAPALDLPLLESVANTTFDLGVNTALNLPSLLTDSGGTYTVADGAVVTATALTSADGVTLSVAPGGTFDAPNLTTFTGGTLSLAGGYTVNVPAFANFDNSRFTITNGQSLAVAAENYSSTGLTTPDVTHTLFSVSGASGTGTASRLDLSSLLTLDAGFDDGQYWSVTVHQIAATDGGQIDLSGLQTIYGAARSEDRLQLDVSGGGMIDLSSLTSIASGYTRFNVTAPAFSLPLLESAAHTTFGLGVNTAMDLPALASHDGGTYVIADGAVLTATVLTAVDGVTLSVSPGGTFNAPNLTTFTGGTLSLTGGYAVNVPPFVSFDNSRFTITNGESLAVAAENYSSTGLTTPGVTHTLFSVSGASGTGTPSRLDLASLLTLDAGFDDGQHWSVTVHQIAAADGGQIDLSGLQTIYGAARSEDRLEFNVSGGGMIDLTSLTSIASGCTRFDLGVNTALSLPALASHNGGTYTVADGAVLTATALTAADGVTLSVSPGGTFNAPNLTTFTDGVLSLTGGYDVNVPPFVNFDNSRFTITNGESLAVAADNYSSTGLTTPSVTHTLFSVSGTSGTGTPSRLDLSSLLTLDAGFDDSNGATTVQQIVAADGGQIDLSGLQTLHGAARSEDRLEFNVSGGGMIDLSSLTSVASGYTRFNVTAPAFALPVLGSAVNTTFDLGANTALSLPALNAQDRGTYTVADGAVLTATALTAADGVTLSVSPGGTFNAPNLTTFTGGVLSLTGGYDVDVPAFVNFDNSRFTITNGESLAVAADNYSSTGLTTPSVTHTLFSVSGTSGTGTPSRLDLSSLLTLDAGFDDSHGGTTIHKIAATDGGQIDLSGLQTLHGAARSEDRLQFDVSGGGSLDLSSLVSIASGHTRFNVTAPAFILPVLESAGNTTFDLGVNTALSLPALASHDGGAYHVADGAVLTAPALTAADGVTLSVSPGGTFNAPNLTTFTGGVLSLTGGYAVNVPPFVSFDNSRFTITNGESLAVAADNYSSAGLKTPGTTYALLTASGTSGTGTPSVLDLSSLLTLDAGFDDSHGGTTIHKIAATEGGQIDAAGIEAITGPVRSEDRLDILATTGGSIDLSSLRSVSGGTVRFLVSAGGRLDLGELTLTDQTQLSVADAPSVCEVHGGLLLSQSSSFEVTGGASLRLTGNFSYQIDDEARFNGDAAIVELVGGPTMQWYEAAGADAGVDGFTSGNFGIAQLVVGTPAQPGLCLLTDLMDNGNRASPEALYLYGSGGLDGLVLETDSVLLLGNVNAYALIDGEMVWLNDLFAAGETFIDFGAGQLGRPMPGDATLDDKINYLDIGIVATNYRMTGAGWTDGDFTFDGQVSYLDVGILAANYGWEAGGAGGRQVPEPTGLCLLALAAAAALGRRRRA